MTVRRARPADARTIADVHVRTWQAAYRHAFPAEVLDNLSAEEREVPWRERLEEGYAVWVAESEGEVVGFAAAGPSRTEEDAGELYAIYVLPESWGSGAAADLMAEAKDWLAREGYVTAMLWVLADNPRARRFYEREGWRAEGTRIDTFRGTEVEEALYRLALVGG
ncbi:MAG TPA: GNAT family N-acetyltransferase [Gaiellaceae bacterium]